MTPAKISDLRTLWNAVEALQEKARGINTAACSVGMEVIPYERTDGARVRVTFLSDKTGGHAVTEPIDTVEEIKVAAERITAHGDGFLANQPKPRLVSAADLPWGHKSCGITAPALWGARAIDDVRGMKPFLDILWDRQGTVGEEKARRALQDKLNGDIKGPGALQAFRQAFADGRVLSDTGEDTVEATVGGVEFVYRTVGGYCYIAARLTDGPDTVKPAKPARKAVR